MRAGRMKDPEAGGESMKSYVDSLVDGLNEIVGTELGSVVFVRDYVQFNFDGPIITFVVDPQVTARGVERTFPNDGSRDYLCALIGKKITGARRSGDRIHIDFEGEGAVSVSTLGPDGAELKDEILELFDFPSDLEMRSNGPRNVM